MRLFIDCEFNGWQGELISMALEDQFAAEVIIQLIREYARDAKF